MRGSSPSAGTRCAGCTRNGWCTSWTRSPIRIAPLRQRVRGLIWNFYADLKAYRLNPGKRRAARVRARFDRIFLRRTGFVTLDRLAGATSCQQGRVADGAGAAGNPAAHQRLRKRYPMSGHAPESQRRDPKRPRTRLPRRFPGACQNLRQARHRRSGIIWAAGSRSQATPLSTRSITTSGSELATPDRHRRPHCCPCYLCTG